jgi:hypothetical protein
LLLPAEVIILFVVPDLPFIPPTSLIIEELPLALGAFNLDAAGNDGVDFFIVFIFIVINLILS